MMSVMRRKDDVDADDDGNDDGTQYQENGDDDGDGTVHATPLLVLTLVPVQAL